MLTGPRFITSRHAVAWWFVGPALLVIGVFFVVPVLAALAMSLTDFDIYALADLRNLRVVGLANYIELLQTSAVLESARQHALLRRGRRSAVARGVARRRAVAQFQAGALSAVLSHRAFRAGRDDDRRRRGDLALSARHALRVAQLCARRHRHSADRLARRSALRDAGDHPVRRVEEFRLQHDHPARRPAEHSARSSTKLRGSTARRRCGSSGTSRCRC